MNKLFSLILIALIICGCKAIAPTISKAIYAFGTTIDITLYEGNDSNMEDICNIYDNYSKLCDFNYSYSGIVNLYDINELAKNEEVIISSELYNIIDESISYYDLTGGYFNIAIGNASFKWKECINNKELIDLTGYNVSISDIILNEERSSIRFDSDIKIDLGAIAKGYTNNIVKNYLDEHNIKKYLISSGSSSLLLGIHKENRDFKVGIKDPIDVSKSFIEINASNTSVTTSGDYESFFIKDNIKYHHILNPKTLGVSHYYHSVSVINDNASLSDALSTALFSMNYDDASDLCNNLSVEAIFYMYDGTINKTRGI